MRKNTFLQIKRQAISDIEKVKRSKISRLSASDKKLLENVQKIIEKLNWKDFQNMSMIEKSCIAIQLTHLFGLAYELYNGSG